MRHSVISQWLKNTEWADWSHAPLAGDASARRYARLTAPDGTRTVILMDAAPEICAPIDRFVEIAGHLIANGFCAPQIFSSDAALGLMILEDLGQTDFSKWLRNHPSDEGSLYLAAASLLVALQRKTPLDSLVRLTPLVGAQMLEPFFTDYAPNQPASLIEDITAEMEAALAASGPGSLTLSLRDFHAENLIWRPEREAHAKIGLLDFQDAFLAPPEYDLVSLLCDARRDVTMATVEGTITHFAAASGTDRNNVMRNTRILSAQRNLRILGIFARLARQRDKPAYLALVPRLLNHIEWALQEPALHRLSPLIRRVLDQEEQVS